ncbi:MAG: hypothetical protein F2845_02700 [Actinobacteria bacterium]|uniref:Unannotated protein n=1 Tax=freshwater metagenome TaxID=449393 RepID=A0A6J7CXD7_9ZZZZ|nr:hypothetical protein [Actinomycetota bacterium]MTA61896.1 hypothetical protein [Actinomycetota bacterium]
MNVDKKIEIDTLLSKFLTMTSYKKRSRTRLVTAIAIICASFISAFILSVVANHSVIMWVTVRALPTGHTVVAADVIGRAVALPAGNAVYFSADRDITGEIVLRTIGAGELLAVSALSQDPSVLEATAVPLSVHGSDIPNGLQAGEVVNLYHVGDSRLSQEVTHPSLLLSHAFIVGVDRKGQNLGGDLTLTISMNVKSVLEVLDATASGRVVVVRVNG